jgi:hypothetical protein
MRTPQFGRNGPPDFAAFGYAAERLEVAVDLQGIASDSERLAEGARRVPLALGAMT